MLLQDTVREQAGKRPDAVAVVFNGQSVSYRELEESGNRLARLLKAAGCRKGDRIGLLLPKSIPALVGMLGALKAECVYVPLDTASPAARLAKIIEVSEPRCILAAGSATNLLKALLSGDGPRNSPQVGWLEPRKPVHAGIEAAFSGAVLPS